MDEKRAPGGSPSPETGVDQGEPQRPEGGAAQPVPQPPPAEKARRRIDTEDEVEEASDESFPASDPPSFNP